MKLCEKKKCTGCMVCKMNCPKDAIGIHYDKFGFEYPYIDLSVCVECGKCKSVCHIDSPVIEVYEPEKIYRYKGKDEVRMQSSSGGFFSLVSSSLLKMGYYIVGVVFDDDYYGVHFEITNSEKIVKRMRKSKYVDARINDVFIKAEQILASGGKILFVGLPCQVAAFLKHIRGRFAGQYYTIDLLCYGSGAPKIYEASSVCVGE